MEAKEILIEIPSPLPAYGAETAAWIKEQITAYPELHSQADWAVKTHCGTRRCIAGWAALLHADKFNAKVQQVIDSGAYDYAREDVEAGNVGEITWTDWVWGKASYSSYEPVGQEVLELSDDETHRLFFAYGEESALKSLDLIIAGKEISYENLELLAEADGDN